MDFETLSEKIGQADVLAAIIDTTQAIMVVTDPQGGLLKVNRAFEEQFGFTSDQVLGRPVWIFRAAGTANESRKLFRNQAVEAQFMTEVSPWRTASGQNLLLRWSVRVLRDENGADLMRIGTAENMTETVHEAARRTMLEQIADNLTEPLFFIKPDGDIGYANRAVERVYGYAPEQLIGRPSSILRPPDKVERMAAYLERLAESGEPEMLETEAVHLDGTRIPVELRTSPVRGSDGAHLGLSSVVYDMQDRRALEEELRRLAGTDPLTGLANRLGFTTAADHEVKRARRYRHPLSVFVADIDHFKKVNDTYGHAAGDTALVRFADLLGWSLRRPIDHVARTGGEEFVAILPETDRDGGISAAERVRRSVEANPICHDDMTFHLTASFGVSYWVEEEEDLADAIQRADEALYEAKNGGRNRVAVKPPEKGAAASAA